MTFKNCNLVADQRDSVFAVFNLALFFRKLWKILSIWQFSLLFIEVAATDCSSKYQKKISKSSQEKYFLSDLNSNEE